MRSTHTAGTAPPFGTPPYDIDCLNSARQALAVCKALQTDFRNSFSLTSIAQWLFLYYPLTPYFILFGNVVSTGDMGDLKIMEETVAFLNLVREESKGMEKLARLMTVFLRVATVLVDARRGGVKASRGGIEGGDDPMDVLNTSQQLMGNVPAVPDPRVALPDEAYAVRPSPSIPTSNSNIGPHLSTTTPGPAVTMAETYATADGVDTTGMQELGGFSDMDWEFFAQQPSMNFFTADAAGDFAFLLDGQNGAGTGEDGDEIGVQW